MLSRSSWAGTPLLGKFVKKIYTSHISGVMEQLEKHRPKETEDFPKQLAPLDPNQISTYS